MNLLVTILVSMAVFGFLISTHEFGHFIAARACGIDVLEFSIGLGPQIFSKKGKVTKYTLRAFPMGGYCLMKGEDEDTDNPSPGSLNAAHPLKRIVVLSAGALMNFLSAAFIFFAIFCMQGTDASTSISYVEAGSPAQAAGVLAGDRILAVNGLAIDSWEAFSEQVAASGGSEIALTVESADGSEKTLAVTPAMSEEGAYRIGVGAAMKFVFLHALTRSFALIGQFIVLIIGVFGGVFSGRYAFTEVFSGPIGVTAEIGRQISGGALPILYIAATIAVSLGFFNLLPLPALDGSRIAFTFAELIKGKPISRKWEGRIHYVGFLILLGFVAVVAYFDITKLL